MSVYVFGMDTQLEQNMISNCVEKRINHLRFVDSEINIFCEKHESKKDSCFFSYSNKKHYICDSKF